MNLMDKRDHCVLSFSTFREDLIIKDEFKEKKMKKTNLTRVEKTNQFFTARPKLASYLMQCGLKGERTVNPYDPSRAAWVFERTDALDKCMGQYFAKENNV